MRRSDDDDEVRSILRDGERRRVPMMFRDSAVQRSIREDAQQTGRDQMFRDATAPALITDAFGDSGAGLHRPGYRFQQLGERATESARMRDEAYRQMEAEEARRWQGFEREIPVRQITGDARVDTYLAREEHDANAWRGPANSGKWR